MFQMGGEGNNSFIMRTMLHKTLQCNNSIYYGGNVIIRITSETTGLSHLSSSYMAQQTSAV
jgi:hypothetical protein